MSKINKLSKSTLIYSIPDILEKIIGIALIPIYTKFLVPEQYGIVAVMSLLTSIIATIFSAGQPNAVMRLYFEYKGERLKIYVGTVVVYTLFLPLVGVIFMLTFFEGIFDQIFNNIEFVPYGVMAILVSYFSCIPLLILALWRANNQPIRYAIYSLSEFVITVSLILFFVAVCKYEAYGRMLGAMISSAISFVVALILVCKLLKFEFSFDDFKKSMHYGLPLVPHISFVTILALSDRYMLQHYGDLADVGIYSLGHLLGSASLFLSAGFGKAWGPAFYSLMKEPSEKVKSLVTKITTYYFSICMLVSLMVALFSRELISVFANAQYSESHIVVPIIVLGALFNCFYVVPVYTLYYFNKTTLIPIITGVSAVVNVVLNLWLIPSQGMIGAAWATVASSFIMLCIVFLLTQRIYVINYEINKLFKVGFLSLSAYILGSVTNSAYQNFAMIALIKISLIAIATAITYILIKPDFRGVKYIWSKN